MVLSPVCSLICLVRSHFLETFFSTEIALIWHMCVNLIKPGKIIISCKIFSTVITWIWLIICVDFLIQLPGIITIFFRWKIVHMIKIVASVFVSFAKIKLKMFSVFECNAKWPLTLGSRYVTVVIWYDKNCSFCPCIFCKNQIKNV